MPLIGYARVSTGEQTLAPQILELKAAGCAEIHEEHGSGGDRSRPVLSRLISRIRPGDTLVIVRLDRLARSLSHLLEVIETLEKKGCHFKSLGDPIDTSSPQGRFTLQIMGAVAELERALIKERTKAGLRSAKAEGRVGGNPGLRSGDRDAVRKNRLARDAAYVDGLMDGAEDWLPIVRRHRPRLRWDVITDMVNAALPRDRKPWTMQRLKRACKRYVDEGMLEARVMSRAEPRITDDRLLAVVAGIAGVSPRPTLEAIARRLEQLHERTPRGLQKWSPSSVKLLVDRAHTLGLIPDS